MTRPDSSPEPVALLDGVRKRFGDVLALDRVDLEVRRGEVLALLGPNGAGKTTAVNLLLGLMAPTEGAVRLFGKPPRMLAARQRVGAMLQISKVPETLKVREHLALVAAAYPQPLPFDAVIEVAGLAGLEDRLFGRLSGGQRQRLLFALAVCGDPDLLFLDEPTVGLDVEARRGLWDAMRRRVEAGGTILLTTHHLEEAEALATRVVLLDRGRVVAEGTPEAVARGVAGRRVRCRTRIAAAEARTWDEVGDVVLGADGVLEIAARVAEPVVRRLLERDPDLQDLEVRTAGLEEAILTVTARRHQEAA